MKTIKVFVVDDEVDICDSVVEYLKLHGYDSRGAHNSSEAFKVLNEYEPDIAVLDIDLKERYNGVDVLKRALRLHPKVKAMMLTGLRAGVETAESVGLGATILRKPIKIAGVRDAVDKVAKAILESRTEQE